MVVVPPSEALLPLLAMDEACDDAMVDLIGANTTFVSTTFVCQHYFYVQHYYFSGGGTFRRRCFCLPLVPGTMFFLPSLRLCFHPFDACTASCQHYFYVLALLRANTTFVLLGAAPCRQFVSCPHCVLANTMLAGKHSSCVHTTFAGQRYRCVHHYLCAQTRSLPAVLLINTPFF